MLFRSQTHDSILFHAPSNEKAADLLRLLISQYENRQPVSHAEQSRLLYGVLCYLMPDAHGAAPAEENGPVRQVAAYISAHLGEDLSLKRLAAEVYLSPAHLVRLFREQTQHSPH